MTQAKEVPTQISSLFDSLHLNQPKWLFFDRPNPSEPSNSSASATKIKSASDVVVSSLFASVISVTTPYPFDVIRTRQQANVSQSGSIVRAGLDIYKRYGISGIYKGLTGVLVLDMPATCLYFFTYTRVNNYLEMKFNQFNTNLNINSNTNGKINSHSNTNTNTSKFAKIFEFDSNNNNLWIEGISGFCASAVGNLIWTPQDNIVQRSQCTGYYNTPRRIAQFILLREGIFGFWNGYLTSVLTWGPLCSLFFINYTLGKQFYQHFREKFVCARIFESNSGGSNVNVNNLEISRNFGNVKRNNVNNFDEDFLCVLSSTIYAGMISIWLTQPLDTLRCQWQVSGTRGINFQSIHHKSIFKSCKHLIKNEGLKTLMFKGYTARLLSTGPDLMLGMISFEMLLKFVSGSYL